MSLLEAHMPPCQGFLQKFWILADLIHQDVEVDLHCQSLVEHLLWHRRGEECEWSVSHHLKDQM